ncbi:ACT domain-containing protein [Candidatus Micrarchaeota archaeon]|nr:ACT domain-containing protein [Candidatus Micrarchaeota archaeon]
MAGINNLKKLLKNLSPVLGEEKYFIATIEQEYLGGLVAYLNYIKAIYRENEGLTLLFTGEIVDHMSQMSSKEVLGPFAIITLNIHSDLLAVGMNAKVSEVLAKENIPCNVFSAYYHDHILVPWERKEGAVSCLKKLSKKP